MAVNHDRRRRLVALAVEQRGHFTSAQAVELGYTHQNQSHHTKAGNWTRLSRGMFRLTELTPGRFDELAQWELWSGGYAVVSHQTALAVHEIDQFDSSAVHLTVPRDFTMTDPGVTLHRADLYPKEIANAGGFWVTTPVRTIIDIAAQAPDVLHLSRLIDAACSRGILTLRTLRTQAEDVDVRAARCIESALGEPAHT